MATATLTKPVEPGAAPPPEEETRRIPRWVWVLVVLGLWILTWSFTKGNNTMELGGQDTTPLHDRISDFGATLGGSGVTAAIGDAITAVVDFIRHLIAIPTPPRPAPAIGWLGVVAIATWIGYAVANWRIALLVLATFLSFGAFGYWEDSMDLLAVTLVSVAVTVLIGFPLAVWMGLSPGAARYITLGIDLLQTMPTFVYLVFVLVFFGIGVPTAVICTVAYALPPIVRIAGFGIRDVSPTTIEATDSMGQTTWQRLTQVQIPMAKNTIILGLNQTILAALSMAIIAAYINGPGTGQARLCRAPDQQLRPRARAGPPDRVDGHHAGPADDRREPEVGDRGPRRRRERPPPQADRPGPACARRHSRLVLPLLPQCRRVPDDGLGQAARGRCEQLDERLRRRHLVGVRGVQHLVSYGLLNPMQDLLANSPWWLAYAGLFAISLVIGGARAFAPTFLCLTGIWFLDLWNDSMVVLNMTIVATILVMVLAVVFGVWMARSRRADLLLRPILDAGQTIPAFVFLLPVLALFGPSRFTAIVAGLVYAAPAAIKLVADGVSGVNQGTVEASRSSGATRWQEITKVQLPMAKGSLVLATNQGLLYVLAMVVIGGLVGAGALGYDVTLGIAHVDKWGKGLAAGLSIVLMGVWIDRVARAAASRAGAGHDAQERAFRIGGWRPAIFTRLAGAGRW